MTGRDGVPASWYDEDPDLAGDTSGSNADAAPRNGEATACLPAADVTVLNVALRRREETAARKLYVWPKRGFLAVAYATGEQEARELLLDEMGSDGSDGSMPCVARAVEAVRAHRPQVFAYGSTAEFAVTESGWLEAEQKASAELLRAAENLYAFAEAFGAEFLTPAGKAQVAEAYETLRANGSKMFSPSWEDGRIGR